LFKLEQDYLMKYFFYASSNLTFMNFTLRGKLWPKVHFHANVGIRFLVFGLIL